ncbi:MAG: Gfo/Idh/MocA family protein, partial [Pirellulaceae bacterium]
MNTRYSRRSWLVGSSAGLALCASAKARSVSAAEKLRVAAVGVKGMGWSDLSSVGSHAAVQFVGFCDIDTQRFDQVDEKFPGVPHFADYREMIAKLGAGVDAVIVSTPDHMHAPIATLAMSQGKHVYCQKPLTHTVWEARQMQMLARQHQLTT